MKSRDSLLFFAFGDLLVDILIYIFSNLELSGHETKLNAGFGGG